MLGFDLASAVGRDFQERVSILVLVDVGVRLYGCVNAKRPPDLVSILVLVDVGVRLRSQDTKEKAKNGFNPCFSGCWGSTIRKHPLKDPLDCFNPCFSGCWGSTCLLPLQAG